MDHGFQRFLVTGEHLLWTGRPRTGIVFRVVDWVLIPFSLIWTAFAVSWNWAVWSTGAPLAFKLFGLPFLLAGLYFVAGRFVLDAWARATTSYAVTNHRVLISERKGGNLRSLEIGSLPSLELNERKDGSGTIRFGPLAGLAMWGYLMWRPSLDSTPSFFRIPDARSVYTLIRDQLSRIRSKSA